jgi:exodeoxyribonuclease V alpha subunit
MALTANARDWLWRGCAGTTANAVRVTEEVLDALELGYAVTVHKAQGSQFPRVLVPVYAARNLDRTMLYTAITRAKSQVILVGDIGLTRRAVEALPHAAQRQVALTEMMMVAG